MVAWSGTRSATRQNEGWLSNSGRLHGRCEPWLQNHVWLDGPLCTLLVSFHYYTRGAPWGRKTVSWSARNWRTPGLIYYINVYILCFLKYVSIHVCVLKKSQKRQRNVPKTLFSQHRERIKVMNLKESTDKKSDARAPTFVKRPHCWKVH